MVGALLADGPELLVHGPGGRMPSADSPKGLP
jgi:hypothetical protein